MTEHCDPYGFAMELRPACCSIVTDLEEYRFTDDAWMQARSADPGRSAEYLRNAPRLMAAQFGGRKRLVYL